MLCLFLWWLTWCREDVVMYLYTYLTSEFASRQNSLRNAADVLKKPVLRVQGRLSVVSAPGYAVPGTVGYFL